MAEAEGKEVVWDRWHKKRTFVREVSGKYAELLQSLLEQPRVYKSKEMPFKGGPTLFVKHPVNPQNTAILQTVEGHMSVYAPDGKSPKHCHMNSAVFYVLEGEGYDVHDGVRYDWEAGDAAIVGNACVHQHFNASSDKPARVLILKAKPLFLFFHLLFQTNITKPDTTPVPGWEGYWPED